MSAIEHFRRAAIASFAAVYVSVQSAPAFADPSPPPVSPSPAASASPAAAPALVVAAEDPKVGAFAHTIYEQLRAGTVDR
ncbi:MAG: hypothetical protein QOJ39_2269, partial [Candidatus Eremiobacteraeota bacterium]|nr:hypothetical protein [Candidatus Eremiobacteraeota bacterium]